MMTDGCAEARFLLQADFDGELDVGGSAKVAAHVARCSDCTAEQAALANLSVRLRTELPYHTAPTRLRQAIEAAILTAGATPIPNSAPTPPRRTAARRPWYQLAGGWMDRALPFGAGIAVAAALVLVVVLPRGGDMMDSVVASHIRALQPGHLMDVVSTDQHTVKPWFDGRLDYAPPVKDLASKGFPLVGGRLDYLAGRPVAALAYGRAKHVIDLYVWPSSSHIDAPPESGERSGYNYLRWTQDEMVFWVVSDLNRAELSEFVERWRAPH
jgi:anti-sigma factor RsiW